MRWLRAVFGGVLVLVLLLPLLPLSVWAFAVQWRFPALLPTEWGGRAWAYLFSPSADLWSALANSIFIALATTFLSAVIGLPAARALGLYTFRGKSLILLLILAPTIVPPLAVVMGIHITFIQLGLADTRLGVILVHLLPILPYMVLILMGGFANYNPNYEAQARSLGANGWQQLRFVILPLISPSLLAASIFSFLISWGQYSLTLLIGGGRVVTLPMLLFSFASGSDRPITAALSLLSLLPLIFFFLFFSSRSE